MCDGMIFFLFHFFWKNKIWEGNETVEILNFFGGGEFYYYFFYICFFYQKYWQNGGGMVSIMVCVKRTRVGYIKKDSPADVCRIGDGVVLRTREKREKKEN